MAHDIKVVSGEENVLKLLDMKRDYLRRVLKTGDPLFEDQMEGHLRRKENALTFLDELDELQCISDQLVLVSKLTFQKRVREASFCSIEMDGKFCKLAWLANDQGPDEYLGYIASVSEL